MATATEEWSKVVVSKRKRAPVSKVKCEEIEKKCQIYGLAKCLQCNIARVLYDLGFEFDRVISNDENTQLQNTGKMDDFQDKYVYDTIEIRNKWRDYARFRKEKETAST